MINRDSVARIIQLGNEQFSGDEILTKLENEGYRVVRAGMVPKLDDLDDVAAVLGRLGINGGQVQHNRCAAHEAALTIRQLRDLALAVLRIDREDVDYNDG
jgi:hypothetical protein